jgi:hypothetical protein
MLPLRVRLYCVVQSVVRDLYGNDIFTAPADLTSSAGGKDAVLLESWKAHKTGFQQGVALFNKNPKKGIAFMQEHVSVPSTA